MFNKEECEYKGGYIVCGNEIVGVDPLIVDQLNRVEFDLQKARYHKEHKIEIDFDEPFEFVNEREFPFATAATPELDKAVEKTMKIMDELDEVKAADKVNDYIDKTKATFEFVINRFVVSNDVYGTKPFNLHTLGNPLELTVAKLCEYIEEIA